MRIPLFPLNTVLFPGGVLPLRIFEPRYLTMVSRCLREDSPFGVVLIQEGSEAGEEIPECYAVGTLARIIDWNRLPDGLLGVSATGGERFRVLTQAVAADRLISAEVERLPAEPPAEFPPGCESLVRLLERVMESAGPIGAWQDPALDDPAWVGHRLAEILPLPLPVKQQLLELDDAVERLRRLHQLVEGIPAS